MAKKKSKSAPDLAAFLTTSKKFKSTVHKGTDPYWETPMLPCGLGPLDQILGGGFGLGRIGEIYGNFSSGKTYILYLFLISCQKKGGTAVLLETEGAFNPEWFAALGGNVDSLILPRCETVEAVFNGILSIAEYGAKLKEQDPDHIICVGWDGIAATPTDHLMETAMDKRDMSKSLAMTQGTQLVNQKVKDTNICVIATNQIRDAIGSMDSATHTPGGKAWPFHSSQRLELKFDGGSASSLIRGMTRDVAGKYVPSKDPIGRWIKAYVQKNKLGVPGHICKLPYYSQTGDLHPEYSYAVTMGIDHLEALFDFFYDGRFCLPPEEGKSPWEGAKVITMPTNGWYMLDVTLDPGQKKFRKGEWPAVVEDHPELLELCYKH